MYHLENGVTEYGLNTKFGTVAHGIELPIPTSHSILQVLDLPNKGCLIILPVVVDSREHEILLVKKACSSIVH